MDTYATVRCCCGRVKSVKVGMKEMTKCECGARLWLKNMPGDQVQPNAYVMNDYPHKDKAPEVTGFFWPRKRSRR